MNIQDEVLVSLRQIIRSIDLYSKKIQREHGLTVPQLVLLKAIENSHNVTIRELSQSTNMSQATATNILDRLEAAGLITRVRNTTDKRKVHAHLTDKGTKLLSESPQMMHQNVIKDFDTLKNWEQHLILSSLQRLASMMNEQPSSEILLDKDPTNPMMLLIDPNATNDK